jgi:hypothetical protein
VRKVLLLASLSTLGTMLFASIALAQDPCPDPDFPRETPDGCKARKYLPDVPPVPASASPTASLTSSPSASPVPVPPSGGPAILLPAAALLLGSGILTYAILRPR